MDVGIHLPGAKVKEQHSEEDLEIIHEAHEVLDAFKAFVDEEYPKCSSFYETAKDVFEEVKGHIKEGKKMVHSRKWDLDQFKVHMEELIKKEPWEALLKQTEDQEKLVLEKYETVKQMEAKVKHERGEGPNVAWLGLPTVEQSQVRKVYAKNLKASFSDAKKEMEFFVGYPDGILTKIKAMHKHSFQETQKALEDLEHGLDLGSWMRFGRAFK